jgi:FAD/FMN-containing dehydrogenase
VKLFRNDSAGEFVNWSGSVRFRPGIWIAPANEASLQTLIRDAASRRSTVRVAGTGHSSSTLTVARDAAAGPECFREVRRRILEHHRKHVGWRVLYRFVAADDAFLSPAHERDCVAISVHQNASLPFQNYFDDIEPILQAHGGRPHWGKRHSLCGDALASLYPKWDRFQAWRRKLDPADVFLSEECAALFGEERGA